MADQQKIARGLQILNGYKPDGVSYDCNAVHDELFAEGPEPSVLGGDDLRELEDLGWRWDDTEESWAVFT